MNKELISKIHNNGFAVGRVGYVSIDVVARNTGKELNIRTNRYGNVIVYEGTRDCRTKLLYIGMVTPSTLDDFVGHLMTSYNSLTIAPTWSETITGVMHKDPEKEWPIEHIYNEVMSIQNLPTTSTFIRGSVTTALSNMAKAGTVTRVGKGIYRLN